MMFPFQTTARQFTLDYQQFVVPSFSLSSTTRDGQLPDIGGHRNEFSSRSKMEYRVKFVYFRQEESAFALKLLFFFNFYCSLTRGLFLTVTFPGLLAGRAAGLLWPYLTIPNPYIEILREEGETEEERKKMRDNSKWVSWDPIILFIRTSSLYDTITQRTAY